MPSKAKFLCLALVIVLAEGTGCGDSVKPLVAGQPIIAQDEIRRFQTRVKEGEFLLFVADQWDSDVELRLEDSRRQVLLATDSLNGRHGWEELPFVSARDQEVTLVVSRLKSSLTGKYRIGLRRGTATARDRERSDIARQIWAEKSSRLGASRWGVDDPRFEALAVRAKAIGDPGLWVSAISAQAKAAARGRDLKRALLLWRKAVTVAESSERVDLLPVLLNELGHSAKVSDFESEEQATYERALVIGERIGEKIEVASALNNLGLLSRRQGRLSAAISRFDDAIAIYEVGGDEDRLAKALVTRAQVFMLLGQFVQAEDDLVRAEVLSQRTAASDTAAVVQLEFGWFEFERPNGDPSLARSRLESALGRYQELQDLEGMSGTLDRLGTVARKSGDFALAADLHRRAAEYASKLNAPNELANVLGGLAEDLIMLGSPDRALSTVELASELAVGKSEPLNLAVLRSLRAVALQRLGRLDEAIEGHRAAVASCEQLDRERNETDTADPLFFDSLNDIYRRAVAALVAGEERFPGRGFAREALAIVERSRARSLGELIAESEPSSEVPPAARDLADRIARLDRHWRKKFLMGSPYEDLLAIESERADLERSYSRAIAARGRPGGERPGEGIARDLGELQREVLDGQTALVYYELGDDESYAWVVRKGAPLAMRTLPKRSDVEEVASALAESLSRSDRPDDLVAAFDLASRLSEAIVGPIESLLDRRRLALVLDGKLHDIPFGVLNRPSDPLHLPLIRRHEIVVLPSATVLAAVRDRRPLPPSHLLSIIGNPIYREGEFRPLEEGGKEARDLLGLSRSRGRVVTLFGSWATRRNVLEGFRGWHGAKITHFVAHALFDPLRPALSGVALGADGSEGDFLYAYEVSRLRVASELVVLSACETGRGLIHRGEGLVGLPQGFLAAGAQKVVVSHWPIQGRATRELMRRFYEELLGNGRAPSAALRAAQLSMLDDPLWRSPAHWAAFSLVGDWLPLSPRGH